MDELIQNLYLFSYQFLIPSLRLLSSNQYENRYRLCTDPSIISPYIIVYKEKVPRLGGAKREGFNGGFIPIDIYQHRFLYQSLKSIQKLMLIGIDLED